MIKKKYLLCAICLIMFLAGCGNKEETTNNQTNRELTKEEKLCNIIYPTIEKFQSEQITYDQFLETIKSDYNNYCTDSNEALCVSLSSMYRRSETVYEIKDCSIYNVNESLGKSMKELCEASNNATKELIDKKDETDKAYVSDIKRSCDLLKK